MYVNEPKMTASEMERRNAARSAEIDGLALAQRRREDEAVTRRYERKPGNGPSAPLDGGHAGTKRDLDKIEKAIDAAVREAANECKADLSTIFQSNAAPCITAQQFAQKAAGLVGGDRARTHGNKTQNHKNIANLWNGYLRCKGLPGILRPEDVAHMMVLLKVARTQAGEYNADDYVDACGYAAVAGEIARDALDRTWSEEAPEAAETPEAAGSIEDILKEWEKQQPGSYLDLVVTCRKAAAEHKAASLAGEDDLPIYEEGLPMDYPTTDDGKPSLGGLDWILHNTDPRSPAGSNFQVIEYTAHEPGWYIVSGGALEKPEFHKLGKGGTVMSRAQFITGPYLSREDAEKAA